MINSFHPGRATYIEFRVLNFAAWAMAWISCRQSAHGWKPSARHENGPFDREFSIR